MAITQNETMETETYSDYVAYEIDSYCDKGPGGPNKCPMCAGDLLKSQIEPSRAMYEKLWDPTREQYRLFVSSRASFLYTCNECRWWCIRDACECIDSPEHPLVFHFDYLIFAVTEKSGPEAFKDLPENTQPWLKALDDPDVYDKDVVRDLPKGLAALMYKRSDDIKGISIRPRGCRDLSKYDPFLSKLRDLIAKKRERKLHKTEPMRLHLGDRVRVIEQTFGHLEDHFYHVAIAKGCLGTVVAYDDFLKSWDNRVRYPIRLETVILPSEDERVFLETLHERPYNHGVDYKVGTVWLMDVDCLDRITDSEYLEIINDKNE